MNRHRRAYHFTTTRRGHTAICVFQIRDLGSTNRTFVNGKRVEAPIPIGAEDEIRFGGVRFYARVETPARPGKRRFPRTPVAVVLLLVSECAVVPVR